MLQGCGIGQRDSMSLIPFLRVAQDQALFCYSCILYSFFVFSSYFVFFFFIKSFYLLFI